MAIEIKSIIVAGASGNVGVPLVTELLRAGFTVSALTRTESKNTPSTGVNVVRSDYTPASLAAALKGHDAVISALGFGGSAEQKKLVDAAVEAKVKVFLPSEFGSNTTNDDIKKILPFSADKTGIVDYLKTKESHLRWVACITGPFFDMGLTAGFLGVNLKEKSATLFDGGDVPLTVSTLPQTGRGAVAILQHLEETANKYVYISSTTVTQKEVVSAAEKITGAHFEVSHGETKVLRGSGFAKLEKQDFSGVIDLLQSVWFEKGSNLGDHRALLWDEKLGLHPESVEEVLKAVLENTA